MNSEDAAVQFVTEMANLALWFYPGDQSRGLAFLRGNVTLKK